MSLLRVVCLTFALLCVSTIVTTQAQAQAPIPNPVLRQNTQFPFPAGMLPNAVGNFSGFPSLNLHEFARTIPRASGSSVIPYFALYPPVYYSHIVPRPYGYSPFALPPGMEPAEAIVQPVEALQVSNPFYHRDDDGDVDPAAPKQASYTPNVIANPFVKDNGALRAGRIAGFDNADSLSQ